MRYLQASIVILTVFLVTSATTAQDLTAAQQAEILQRAHSLYYKPSANGLAAVTCDIKLDWSKFPQAILAPAEKAGPDYLHETKFQLAVDTTGAQNITRAYPRGALQQSVPAYDKFYDWASKVIGGFLMSWKSKAIQDPFPDAKSISHFASTPDGYQISTRYSDTTVVLSLSKDLVITRILTLGVGESIDERTTYTQTPQGLTLTAVDATNTAAEGTNHIAYDLIYQPTDIYRSDISIPFPNRVHLAVNNQLDMRFSFQNCLAKRGTTVKASPPPGGN
jgi:hypothetical protein